MTTLKGYMMKNLAWKMFKNTGNIESYMEYKNIKDNKPDFSVEVGEETIVDGEKCHISKQKEWSHEK
jgi:hypothetical protein